MNNVFRLSSVISFGEIKQNQPVQSNNKRKKEIFMNYMKQVAETLGVKLEEEFYITNSDKKHRLNDVGLQYLEPFIGQWINCHDRLFRLLNGSDEIVKPSKPILTDEEKEYLKAVIKPFRDKVYKIEKIDVEEREFIQIFIDECYQAGKIRNMYFPSFPAGEMYTGMESNKAYTLDELGL